MQGKSRFGPWSDSKAHDDLMVSRKTSLNVTGDLFCCFCTSFKLIELNKAGESRPRDLTYFPTDSPNRESWPGGWPCLHSSSMLALDPLLAPSSGLQVLLLATWAGGSPICCFPRGRCSLSGSKLELLFSFPLTNRNASRVCPIGLAVPDVSGVGSHKAAQPRGSSTALHNGSLHVIFHWSWTVMHRPLGMCSSSGSVRVRREKPNSKTSGKTQQVLDDNPQWGQLYELRTVSRCKKATSCGLTLMQKHFLGLLTEVFMVDC
uniref:uncharacterized protein LOC118543702 n=1 Tax=Halichoerus grypus TaxID=9711 RepID=UPI00165A0257|nr:uncharacterized protein LOC118543702 [Halichoerus grypus]